MMIAALPPLAYTGPAVEARHAHAVGSVDIFIAGALWFPAAGAAWVRHRGRKLSAADGSLSLVNSRNSSGIDSYGSYFRTAWRWADRDEANATAPFAFETAVRRYESHVAFEQTFLSGASATATGDKDGLVSGYPSFRLPASAATDPVRRGYLSYQAPLAPAYSERPASSQVPAYSQRPAASQGTSRSRVRWSALATRRGSGRRPLQELAAGWGAGWGARALCASSLVTGPGATRWSSPPPPPSWPPRSECGAAPSCAGRARLTSRASPFVCVVRRGTLSYGVMGNVSGVPAGFFSEALLAHSAES